MRIENVRAAWVVLQVTLLTLISMSCSETESYSECDKFARMTSAPFDIEHVARQLLDLSSGATSSRRSKVNVYDVKVDLLTLHVSPQDDRMFAIFVTREPNRRSNYFQRNNVTDTFMTCFGAVFERISDTITVGGILQNVYFVSYPIEDSSRLYSAVCNTYYGHDNMHNGYATWDGSDPVVNDVKTLNPYDRGFWEKSPIWKQLADAEWNTFKFRINGDSVVLDSTFNQIVK